MPLVSDLFVLVLYVTQQAGVMLGVGAETVLLVAYLLSLPGAVEAHGAYVRAARFAERLGLGAMVASGGGIVALHLFSGQGDVLMAPAFLFKWILIAAAISVYPLERWAEKKSGKTRSLVRGLTGGSWYALFLVHTVAPAASWPALLVLYVLWMAAFGALWAAFVSLMHKAPPAGLPKIVQPKPAVKVEQKPVIKPIIKPVPAPVHIAPAPAPVHVSAAPAPKSAPAATKPAPAVLASINPKPSPAPEAPHVPLPALTLTKLEAPHAAPAPAPLRHPHPAPAPKAPVHVAAAPAPAAPKEGEHLPKVFVMPKGPEDLPPGAMVQFG